MGSPRVIASPRALRPAGARRPTADAPSLREAASSARPLSEVCHGLCQCVDLGADAIPCPLSFLLPFSGSLSVALCLPVSVSPSPCVPARSCLSVCLSASASRRLGSVSLNLHLFLSLSLLTPGLPRVLWLWPWLPRLRRPAVSRGVGACECLCVCPCACMSLVRSLRKVLCLEGGVGARGASVGRRGGADELWFTALVAPGGFGHRAGAGQDGRSGPRLGCAQARRRLRGPRAPAGPRGHAALSSEALGGGGGGGGGRRPPSGGGPGGSQGGRAPRPPRPSPHRAPHPTPAQPSPAHARPAAGMPGRLLRVQGPGSRKPCGPPGRAGPGGCWPGVAVCGARSGVGRPHGRGASGRGSCSSSAARAPWRAAAGWPERQVRGKGRRSAGLLGRPAAAAPVYGHTTLNAPDLV